MKFEDVLKDIEKLVGRSLSPIARAQSVKVVSVNRLTERIETLAEDRYKSSRSFSDFKLVWEALVSTPAVHVDAILLGGGTRRNQPETILANLPYVEHLKINQKKHIAWVRKNTHLIGSLKEMDAIAAEQVRQQVLNAPAPPNCVIVVDDIQVGVSSLESASGFKANAIVGTPSAYRVHKGDLHVLLVAANILAGRVLPGTYLVTQVDGGETVGTVDGLQLAIRKAGILTVMTVSKARA